MCFFPFGFEYFSVFPNIVTKLIPIQSDLLIYVYFHSIALTSRKQRRNNDFPLTLAPIPIKEVLPQLLKKQLLQEYEAYAKTASDRWFHELFELLDHATPEELETVRKAFAVFSNWHSEKRAESREEQEDLVRIE